MLKKETIPQLGSLLHINYLVLYAETSQTTDDCITHMIESVDIVHITMFPAAKVLRVFVHRDLK